VAALQVTSEKTTTREPDRNPGPDDEGREGGKNRKKEIQRILLRAVLAWRAVDIREVSYTPWL
jgi:hypothetical protein